jgi:hypothetical protein
VLVAAVGLGLMPVVVVVVTLLHCARPCSSGRRASAS